MHKPSILLTALSAAALLNGCSSHGVTNLRCEYTENPVGIDETNPRFTWNVDAGSSNQYVVEVAESEEALSAKKTIWK